MALAVLAQGIGQAALPDEAPRSDHVGDDIYLQLTIAHFALHKINNKRL